MHLQQCLHLRCEKADSHVRHTSLPLPWEESREAACIRLIFYRHFKRGRDYCTATGLETRTREMHCHSYLVHYLSLAMILAGLGHLINHKKVQPFYGRYMGSSPPAKVVPARVAWFLQEMPAFLVPLLLMLTWHNPSSTGKYLLLGTFCTHYFQR